MRKGLVTLLMLCATLTASAQQDDEYLMEIGGGVGMVSYQGDFNGKITSGMQPAGAIVWRRLLNPYMGFRVTGMMGKLKGDATRVETYYPDETTRAYSFDRSLTDVSMTYEYNFWPYGTGRDYRGAKRLTPFVFGVGRREEGVYRQCSDRPGHQIQTEGTPQRGVGMEHALLAERRARRHGRPLWHQEQRSIQEH